MKILIVEDDTVLVDVLKKGFVQKEFEVDVAYDGYQALSQGLENTYDVILLDIVLPKQDGIEVLKQLREHNVDSVIVIITGRSEIYGKFAALSGGANGYAEKPFGFTELFAQVQTLLEDSNHRKET